MIWALDELGFPYLVAGEPGDDHARMNARAAEVHALVGEDVAMVIGDYLSIPACLSDDRCVWSVDRNPFGIETHKLFIFDGEAFPLDARDSRR